jgi:hypothetical protein
MAMKSIPYHDGMKVRLGYDQLTGDISPSEAVTGSLSTVPTAMGNRVTFECITADDSESLHKALDVSVEAQGAYMGFSANAKVDYASECDSSSFSSYVIVKCTVENAMQTLDNPQFVDDAKELILNANSERFRQRFGDYFISGIKTGGQYYGIYQIISTSESDRENIKVAVRAAYKTIGASAQLDAAVQTATSHSKNHTEVNIHVFREGSLKAISIEPAQIIEDARNFPDEVEGENAFPYSVILQSYTGLKSPNDAYNYIDTQVQQDALLEMSRRRFTLKALYDDLGFVVKHPDDFQMADGSDVNVDEIVAKRNEVATLLNALDQRAKACLRDATQCGFEATSALESYPVPKLRPGRDKPRALYPVPNLIGRPYTGIAACFYAGPGHTNEELANSQDYTAAQDYIPNFDPNLWKFGWNGDIRYGFYVRDNTIVSQDPPAGSMAEEGTVISVTMRDETLIPEDQR